MPVPWARLLDAALGMTDLARRVTRRPPPGEELTAAAAAGGPLEARLAGVVVAALKEAFDRDSRRLDLEREQLEAERQRAERAIRLELLRQAADREIGRLRLMAGVAVATWLGTLFFSTRLIEGSALARTSLGVGWLLLLGALGAAFSAQSFVARALAGMGEGRPPGGPERAASHAVLSSGFAGVLAPWLIVAGLAAIALSVLLS